MNNEYNARGNFFRRLWSTLFLLLAWYLPHSKLRVFFHKMRGVNIGKNVEIGYFVIIGNVNPSQIHIRDNATITARCTILEHDNSGYYTGRGNVRVGEVIIENNAFIGIGSVILPGVTIGRGSIVGALSLVNRDIPPNSVYAGSPAKKINKT
tara:strand:+ start:315 stop:770 length:456 start_codon:yes stop_codon:yes gene_type:complete